LYLKNILLLNPCYPVAAFVEHGFASLRCSCSNITIMGDRGDNALFFSEIGNGMMNYFGYKQPEVLNFRALKDQPGVHRQVVIGRHIDMIFLPDSDKSSAGVEQEADIEQESEAHDIRLVFKTLYAQLGFKEDATLQGDKEPLWLDCDIIDTTLLESNIQGLRHSYFNLNPVVVKDFREIFLTGRRAKERASLLYRKGNIFSYCQAPSVVVSK